MGGVQRQFLPHSHRDFQRDVGHECVRAEPFGPGEVARHRVDHVVKAAHRLILEQFHPGREDDVLRLRDRQPCRRPLERLDEADRVGIGRVTDDVEAAELGCLVVGDVRGWW